MARARALRMAAIGEAVVVDDDDDMAVAERTPANAPRLLPLLLVPPMPVAVAVAVAEAALVLAELPPVPVAANPSAAPIPPPEAAVGDSRGAIGVPFDDVDDDEDEDDDERPSAEPTRERGGDAGSPSGVLMLLPCRLELEAAAVAALGMSI
jgi:hypothetical protein